MADFVCFHGDLKDRHRRFRKEKRVPEELIIRLHRSLSWLERFECHLKNEDWDEALIVGWIAFSALYTHPSQKSERGAWTSHFRRIESFDFSVFEDVLKRHHHNVKQIVKDKTLHKSYWSEQPGLSALNFEDENEKFVQDVKATRLASCCAMVISRVYLLRNQIMHGAATYKSKNNRIQIQCSVFFLHACVVACLRTAFEHPDSHGHDLVNPV